MGLGYTIFGPLFLMNKLNCINPSSVKLNEIVKTARKYLKLFSLETPETSNLVKQIASNLTRGSVWFIGSSHLAGNVHVAANQLNENAKRFGSYFVIPELNHHLLEGLSFPEQDLSTFLFIESDLYDKRIQKRFVVTKEILAKNSRQFITYRCNEKKCLLEAVEVLVFGSYLSFYTAMFENVDPTAIPTVDFLKAALKGK
jgi:glucose/mannose-6-phosphate isomerase